jgi:ribosomal protein S18 acetylase RimI-like enzyme/2-polyprenyl-3-methyl-5-hydroxy-6-metoxy-1,4-benzoquinol methylase
MQCQECGAVSFTGTIPDRVAFDQWTKDKCWEVTNSRRHLMLRIAHEIKVRSRGRSLLDVGCSMGAFLELFERNAWKRSGIDPSAAAMHRACEFADAAYTGTLEDGSVPSGAFDAISILDAIYYSRSPRRMLTRASQLLNPGGLLVIEFPNYEYSLLRRGSSWRSRSHASLQYDSLHRYMLPTAAVLDCAVSLGLFLEHAILLGPPSRRNWALDWLGRGVGKLAVAVAVQSQGLIDIAPRLALFFRHAGVPRRGGTAADHMVRTDIRSAGNSDLRHIAGIRRQAFPDGISAWLSGAAERTLPGSEIFVAHSAGAVTGFVEVWPHGLPLAGVRNLARGHLLSAAVRFLTSGGAFDELVKHHLVGRAGGPGVEIRAVAVDAACRSRGIGSALIAHGAAQAREMRPGLAVFAWVRASNHASISAFRKNHFKVSGIRFSSHAPELLLVAAPLPER